MIIRLSRGRQALREFLPLFVAGIPVILVKTRVVADRRHKRHLGLQRQLRPVAGVILIHALHLSLHDELAHLCGIALGLGCLIFVRSHHGIHGVADVLLFAVFQFGLPCTDGTVCLLNGRAALAAHPVHLGLQTLLAALVVTLAHGGIHVSLEIGQVIHHGVIGGGQLLGQAAVGLVDVGQDGFRRIGTADLAAGHHLGNLRLVRAGGVGQRLIHIHAPFGEVIEVFLRGLAGRSHAAQARDEHIDIGGIQVQTRRSV